MSFSPQSTEPTIMEEAANTLDDEVSSSKLSDIAKTIFGRSRVPLKQEEAIIESASTNEMAKTPTSMSGGLSGIDKKIEWSDPLIVESSETGDSTSIKGQSTNSPVEGFTKNPSAPLIYDWQLEKTTIRTQVGSMEQLIQQQQKVISMLVSRLDTAESHLSKIVGEVNVLSNRVNEISAGLLDIDAQFVEVGEQAARIVAAHSIDENIAPRPSFTSELKAVVEKTKASASSIASKKSAKPISLGKNQPKLKRSFA